MVYRSCSYATSIRDDSGIIKCKDRVVINVGGTRHECYLSTIQNFPDTRLYWIAESAKKMVDFDPDRNEFFFDRHPGCFQNILNYCRTGKLHCPNDVCGPLFEQELGFWGVDELMMEPCCWGNYTQHREAHKNLKMFDKIYNDDEGEIDDDDFDHTRPTNTDQSKFMRAFLFKRKYIWGIMEKPFYTRHAQAYALVSMGIIILSILTFCLQTMDHFNGYVKTFLHMEFFYCGYFTLEFIVRMGCCPSLKEFFKGLMTWLDIVSTMQFYYNFITKQKELDLLFVLRLIRIFRLFRFFKNLSGMQVIAKTLKSSAQELCLLAILMCIPMLIFSTLMFYAEKSNPKNTFPDIPSTCWWAMVTMTTVGYGDNVPESAWGKMIGVCTSISGVLIVALPVSVIGSNFTLYYSYAKARMRLPKRQSPALVTADKALVHDGISSTGNDQNDKPKPHQGRAKGKVPNTLHGLAEVMVEITVPNMERRHAIMPPITPITRTNYNLNNRRNNIHSYKNSSVDSLMVPMPGQHTASSDMGEGRENRKISSSWSPRSRRASTVKRGLPINNTLRTFFNKFGNANTAEALRNIQLEEEIQHSKSDDGQLDRSEARSPDTRRHKRSLHIDISRYNPRRLSRDEKKIRKKLSQSEFMPWMSTITDAHSTADLHTKLQNEIGNRFSRDIDELSDTLENPISLLVTEEENIEDPLIIEEST